MTLVTLTQGPRPGATMPGLEQDSEVAAPTDRPRINLDQPRYDQSTYAGRAKHFYFITNPLNVFASSGQLEKAKELVTLYRQDREPAGISDDEVWRAKQLYDSAYHPDTGEKMFLLGRMSCQVPGNMAITGCMMTFYRSTPAILFWQWFNQSFNAIVNYTNRSGGETEEESHNNTTRLGISYALATTAATGTGLALNKIAHKFPPLLGRYVPFAAVAAANCINIPFMRSREVSHGIPVFTGPEMSESQRVGDSKVAAKKGITQVVISRILLASPVMLIPPIMMQKLERGHFLKRYPMMNAPIQVGMVGFLLAFATPLCCAIFPQKSSVSVSSLEPELQDKVRTMDGTVSRLYYNKGL